jgi:hypothetical protein
MCPRDTQPQAWARPPGRVAGSPARRRPAPRRRPRKVPEPYLAESPKFEAIDGGPFRQVYTFGPNCQDGGLVLCEAQTARTPPSEIPVGALNWCDLHRLRALRLDALEGVEVRLITPVAKNINQASGNSRRLNHDAR